MAADVAVTGASGNSRAPAASRGRRLISRGRGLWASQPALLPVILVLAVSTMAHVRGLDRFVVDDERRWVCRAIDFRKAIAARNPAETFQVGHPGVITMAAAGAALGPDRAGPWWSLCPTTAAGEDFSDLDNEGQSDLQRAMGAAIFSGRQGIAWFALALLGLLAIALGRLPLDPVTRFSAIGVVALDPYLVGLTRVVHTDGLVALLSLLSITLLASGGTAGVVLSGAIAGVAMLNKVSAVALVPCAVLWLGWTARGEARLRDAAVRTGEWTAAAVVTALALWPALLAHPASTVAAVAAKTMAEAGAAHPTGVYFLGHTVGDPGPMFYPVVLLLRATPAALVGTIAAVAWVALGRIEEPGRQDSCRRVAVAGLLLAAMFLVEASASPKKLDRYLAPALAGLDLAAGVTLGALLGDAWRRARKPSASTAWAAGLAVLMATPLLGILASHPYELAYYDPLTGGAQAAARRITVGWGEGYDLAADFLNAEPDAGTGHAAASDMWSLGALYHGQARAASDFTPGRTDFLVVYVSDAQRNLSELNQEVAGRSPRYTGWLFGVPFVRVYRDPSATDLDDALLARAAEGDLLVAPGESPFARSYGGGLPIVRYWGHWGPADLAAALATWITAVSPAGATTPVGRAVASAHDEVGVWVVRYPALDSNVAAETLEANGAVAGATMELAGGAVELRSYRWAPGAARLSAP